MFCAELESQSPNNTLECEVPKAIVIYYLGGTWLLIQIKYLRLGICTAAEDLDPVGFLKMWP